MSQTIAEQLDIWATDGLYKADLSRHIYLFCGLSKATRKLDILTILDQTNSREFNKFSRFIWLHMLFDRLASYANLRDTLPSVENLHLLDDTQIRKLRKDRNIHYVRNP